MKIEIEKGRSSRNWRVTSLWPRMGEEERKRKG
jgi:hypothetical protein